MISSSFEVLSAFPIKKGSAKNANTANELIFIMKSYDLIVIIRLIQMSILKILNEYLR